VSLLRIRASLLEPPERCEWALVDEGREPIVGEGLLSELPRRAERVQLVVPAAQVLLTRVQLPRTVRRRRAGSMLAYAVEERIAAEPEANQVSWLGTAGADDVLAVVDRPGLERWRAALAASGILAYEVHCETLFLPWGADEWSLAWDGGEGLLRTGEFEGAATDCGDRDSPPMSVRMMLEDAQARGAAPTSIALYTTAGGALPDLEAWQGELGTPIRSAGSWDWRTASTLAGVSLSQERKRWGDAPVILRRLRPAAWIVCAALAIHAAALTVNWTVLAGEERGLRRQMVAQFRATFPEAVAVVEPELQMRRKLADARHAAGKPDPGDFLPMTAQIAAALKDLGPSALRKMSFESGRMTLELDAPQPSAALRFVERLKEAGLSVTTAPASPRSGHATVTLTVRAL
jgi:general secretion pathway protein L